MGLKWKGQVIHQTILRSSYKSVSPLKNAEGGPGWVRPENFGRLLCIPEGCKEKHVCSL